MGLISFGLARTSPHMASYWFIIHVKSRIALFNFAIVSGRGTPKGGEEPGPHWDLKNIIFSRLLPLNYAICIFEVSFFAFCYVGGLRKPAG